MKKVFLLAVLLVLTLVSTTACYYNKQVGSNQIGLKMDDGVTINEVVGSGRYTNLGWYAGLTCIDTASHTLVWEDADVWTSDKQVVGFTASATYARKSDEESVRKMWKEYNAAARDDEQLDQLVRSRIPRIVKQVSTQMTLDEMLGIAESDKNRTTLQENIETLLSAELDNCGIQLIDFGVNNISVDPVYQSKMQEKSTAAIEIELAQQRAQQYGGPENSSRMIAELWEPYIRRKCVSAGADVTISAEDVAAMMVLFKMARVATGSYKADSWIDAAGYAACGGELAGGKQ